MNIRTQEFIVCLVFFLVMLFTVAIHQYRKRRRFSSKTLESLLGQLLPVDRDNIALVAGDAMDEIHRREEPDADGDVEPSRLWLLVGGLEGIEALVANCDVMIELACYVQRSYPEALVVAEQLRLHARELRWHLGRLQGAAQVGSLSVAFPDYAQQAVTTYYVMTRQLIRLYEVANVPGSEMLQRAL